MKHHAIHRTLELEASNSIPHPNLSSSCVTDCFSISDLYQTNSPITKCSAEPTKTWCEQFVIKRSETAKGRRPQSAHINSHLPGTFLIRNRRGLCNLARCWKRSSPRVALTSVAAPTQLIGCERDFWSILSGACQENRKTWKCFFIHILLVRLVFGLRAFRSLLPDIAVRDYVPLKLPISPRNMLVIERKPKQTFALYKIK